MNEELRAAISEQFGEDTVLYDGCDDAVIGVTNCANSTGQVVYDYEKLVECFISKAWIPMRPSSGSTSTSPEQAARDCRSSSSPHRA